MSLSAATPYGTGETSGWQASLGLRFESRGARTIMRRTHQHGPLTVQKPFYPEGSAATCHTYLLHPPGGIVGGDNLQVNISVTNDAAALITTPAATKVYRTAGPQSRVSQRLQVGASGQLEWLPQDNILFGGSRFRNVTEVDLATGARFIGWEQTCLGRPASGDAYDQGRFSASWRIRMSGQPVVNERVAWESEDPFRLRRYGLGGYTVMGTLFAFPADDDIQRLLSNIVTRGPDLVCATTLLDNVVAVRVLAHNARIARQRLLSAWQLLRPPVMGKKATTPRIWAT